MAVHRLKHTFSAGELSPMMHARSDFERFQNGCRKLYNMVCATQGPAVRRPGLAFIYDLNSLGIDTEDPQIREIPFIFNELQAYALVFFKTNAAVGGHTRMAIGFQDGIMVGQDESYEVKDIQTEVFTGPTTFNLTALPNATYTSIKVYYIYVTDDGVTFRDELVDTTHYTVSVSTTINVNVTYVIPSPHASYDKKLEFDISYDTDPVSPSDVIVIDFPAGWDNSSFDWAQSADEMTITQTGLKPHVIKRYAHDYWVVVEKTFTSQPADWSDDYGWPERVTFHQQRLAFAANKLRRQTVWMSKAGDFDDFGYESPLRDSDAVTFTLDSGTQNRIQWITSGKSLHIGTLGNEWTVVGGTQAALTPTNILAQRQTNNGSEPNKPLLVGLTTLFVERHGRTVNEFVYDYTFDSYKTSDMAILSPHVTEHYSIVDWAYQQTPDSIIWCVREDGDLLGITYQRQHKVVGWHHHDTEGLFKAITCVPGTTREDDVWVVVEREVQGEKHFFLEKLEDWFKGETAEEGRFLDSHVVYQGDPVDTVSVSHLAGKEVSVLADGTAHPPVSVSLAGEVTLNNSYSHVVIGLPYASEVWPYSVEFSTPDGGTSFGRTQRILEVHVDLYRSLGMVLGRYDSQEGVTHEEEIPFRVPTDLMGQQVPLFTGVQRLAFPNGYDREAIYFIKQTQPFPLVVRGAVDVVEVME